MLFGFEIKINDAGRQPCLLCNLGKGEPRQTIPVDDVDRGLNQLGASIDIQPRHSDGST